MHMPHHHLSCRDAGASRVRKLPGSMPGIRYHASASRAGCIIWSKGQQGNWHLPAGPVPATLSSGDIPRTRIRGRDSLT